MPKGIERFQKHFAAHTDKYVLIGGTACELALIDAGFDFRATKDLDIVLTIETLDVEFSRLFWEFVQEGGYDHARKDQEGATQCYRFTKPTAEGYPYMLELFARNSSVLAGRPIVRVFADEDASSLSAILMDDAYYILVAGGRVVENTLSRLAPSHLIPLKAKAFLDLSQRRAEKPESVKSDDIKKHKNDVFRLSVLLTETTRVPLSPTVADDLRSFLAAMEQDPPDLKAINVTTASLTEVIARLRETYQLAGTAAEA